MLAIVHSLCACQLAVLAADAHTGVPIPDARVEIAEYNLTQRTDSMGELRFAKVQTGLVLVTASRLGYQPMKAAVVLRPRDSNAVVFLMHKLPPTLDTVRVKGDYWSPYASEFETRMRTGLGRFLRAAQLDSARGESVADLVANRFPGIRAQWSDSRTSVRIMSTHSSTSLASRGWGCVVRVYLDGQRRRLDDVAALVAQDLIGVEYYSIAPPPQYPGGDNACGSLLLWTRR